MAEAEAEAERNAQAYRVKSAGAFRSQGEQDWILSRDRAERVEMLRSWVAHVGGIVRSGETGLGGEERAFDMPSGDNLLEFGGVFAQLAEVPKAVHHPGPPVGDQGKKKTVATISSERAGRVEKLLGGKIVLLKVDSCKPIYLKVE